MYHYSGAKIDPNMHDQTCPSGYTGCQNEPLNQSSLSPTTQPSGGAPAAGAMGTTQPQGRTGRDQTQSSSYDEAPGSGTAGQQQRQAAGGDQPSTGGASNLGQSQQAGHVPTAGERIKGSFEKLGGKLMHNPEKVAHGDDIAKGRGPM